MEEAHNRGIEIHAWLNPYRAAIVPDTAGMSPGHVCLVQSQYCYSYGTYMWLDPGAPGIADQLASVIEDLVTR